MTRTPSSAPGGRRRPPRSSGPISPDTERGWLWPAVLIILFLAALGGGMLLTQVNNNLKTAENEPNPTIAAATPNTAIEGVVTYSNLARNHTSAPQTYPQSPPVGGDHNEQWTPCGIYEAPVPNEFAVHSLEHGAVWIAYRPDLPAADVEQLAALLQGSTHLLLSPYPGLTSPIVLSAWGLQLPLEQVGDPRLATFIKTYQRGPQTPEPGSIC